MATILGPYVAMWWLARAKTGLLYFFVLLALLSPSYILDEYQVPETDAISNILLGTYIVFILIYIIGIVYSVRYARALNPDIAIPYYARWYSVIIFTILTCFIVDYEEIMQGNSFYRIPSENMAPSSCKGEYFIVDYYARGILSPGTVSWPPERGDMVVIEHKGSRYVSRIVGLPGEKIQIKQGTLFINEQDITTEAVWYDEVCRNNIQKKTHLTIGKHSQTGLIIQLYMQIGKM